MVDVIERDKYVVVQKFNGEHIRVMRFSKGQKVLIEKLKFDSDSAIGHPFGLFEVSSGKVKPISVDRLKEDEDLDAPLQASPEDVENSEKELATELESEAINPAQGNQKLTQEEVLEMKSSGTSAAAMVAKLVEGNKSFTQRTKFSQSKYIRRKTKKHSDRVFILNPTIRTIAQSYYLKDAERISNLRIDQLGLLLQYGAVFHGRNVLLFDQVLGLCSSAVVERLGGKGSCIHLHRGLIAQSIPCVQSMNYDDKTFSTFLPVRLSKILYKDEDEANAEESEKKEESEESMETDGADDVQETAARKTDRLAREKRGLAIMNEQGVDSLIIAARSVDIVSVLETLFSKVAPSGSIAIYSSHLQLITEAQSWLIKNNCVNVHLTSQMYRVHQVLPERTHPLMSQHVVGGYVLSGIKVIPAV